MTATLYRPVGLYELALIWDKEMREFPPRLAHQPIFYPVAKAVYARQIARDWNTADEKSGFSGFVTTFELEESYLSNFQPHTVGTFEHVEYWIPAEKLNQFNSAIRGLIGLREAYFGPSFTGYIPDGYNLKGKDATAQFVALYKTWGYNTFDVACEVSANRKAVFLNWLYWSWRDFSLLGVNHEERGIFLERLKQCWQLNHIEVPLPQAAND